MFLKQILLAYISQHKDKYEVEATRDISFVEFKEVASVEDEDNLKADLLNVIRYTKLNLMKLQKAQIQL